MQSMFRVSKNGYFGNGRTFKSQTKSYLFIIWSPLFGYFDESTMENIQNCPTVFWFAFLRQRSLCKVMCESSVSLLSQHWSHLLMFASSYGPPQTVDVCTIHYGPPKAPPTPVLWITGRTVTFNCHRGWELILEPHKSMHVTTTEKLSTCLLVGFVALFLIIHLMQCSCFKNYKQALNFSLFQQYARSHLPAIPLSAFCVRLNNRDG